MRNKRVLLSNAVIFKGLGIAPLIVAGNSLSNAMILSVAVVLLLVSTRLIAAIINSVWQTKHRSMLYALCAGVCYIGVFFVLNRIFGIAELLQFQLYLPLLVMDTIVIKRAERHSREPWQTALSRSLSTSAGFALAVILIATLREFLSTGAVSGFVIMDFAIFPMARLASGGFIITGIVIALWKCGVVLFWKIIEMGAKSSQ